MPWEEISNELRNYDQARPRINEIAFIQRLQEQYEQNEESIFQRLGEVRQLNKPRKDSLIIEWPNMKISKEQWSNIFQFPYRGLRKYAHVIKSLF